MKRYFTVPSIIKLIESIRSSDRWILRMILICVVAASIWFLLSLNNAVSVTEVRSGGTVKEGIIGTPRFVNPVLALTRADQDVTALLYSGLFSVNETGALVPDIARDWQLSNDGTVYTVTLRTDVRFHDDIPLTATDVVFTIDLVQNNDLKSPLQGNWNGVEASIIDDHTVEIILEEPYAPFIENLTLGILPAHIWREIPIEQVPFSSFNTTPIGSGPYKITKTRFSPNATVSQYHLEPHGAHTPVPFLADIFLRFYADQASLVDAWDGDVTSSAYLEPRFIQDSIDQSQYQVAEIPLTRTFAIFFNQNRSAVLRDAAVREALELALDREQIVDTALDGAGVPSATAVNFASDELELDGLHAGFDASTESDGLTIATMVLEDAGWNQTEAGAWEKGIGGDTTPLQLTIKTVNSPLFESTLNEIVTAWEQLGVTVVTEQFTQSDLVQSVIRERDFELLLFGVDPGRTQDVYPFWHSSQQNDPGLNIAQYTNLIVDEALETARTTTDADELQSALATINTIITEERPAIFLFRPTMQYVIPQELTSTFTSQLGHPSGRFSMVPSWYTRQQSIWPFFSKHPTSSKEDLHTAEQNNN